MNQKTRVILIGLLILFVAIRLPGLAVPYQQDEFKTAIAAEVSLSAASTFLTHPPLTALLLRADAVVFGGAHMRLLPLIFGLLSAVLLFYVVRRRFDEQGALWAVFLYTISFYGVWSSLMLDTDGAILPTLFLAALYCYDRAREIGDEHAKRWLFLFVLSLITGLLVKLSFILVVGVFVADFLFEKRRELTASRIAYLGMVGVGLGVLTAAAFVLAGFFAPAFSMQSMISHALYYVHWSGRSYLQVAVESIKALFYLSPLLIAPLILTTREEAKKAAPFLWYLALGLVFYLVLFDFSHGALDKYLMFTIIPLCVVSGAVLSRISASSSLRTRPWLIIAGVGISVALLTLLLVPPEVVPLYPKTLWFSRVLHGSWNILTPFNGGSGPVGFYVSFLVIACGFLLALVAAIAGRARTSLLSMAAVVILSTSVAYNMVFVEEFSFGKVYGSAPEALNSALTYLRNTSEVTGVITYNDIGAYELKHIGKYDSHFTAAPQFEAAARITFPAYGGDFLVVDIPPLYNGFYTDFFKSCKILFTARSGVITSTVYSVCTWTKE
jgi:hypothetical protein